MAGSPEDIISNLRAIIISSKGGLKLSDVKGDYKETFGEDVPLKTLGCNSIEEFFKNNPKNFTVVGTRVQAVTKASSLHIASLVNQQKTAKKKGRSKLSSREARCLRKPFKTSNDSFPHVYPKKSNRSGPLRPLKQNSKESLSSSLKQSQMQQVNKKRVDDGEPKAGKVLDKIEKEKHIKDLANEVKHFDLKGIQRTVQNDLVLPAKDTDSSNSKNELVPFEDVEDFHGTKTSQSRLLKLKSSGSFRGSNLSNNSNSHNNNNSNNNKNNNNNTSESLNQNYGFNLSPLTSPFRRSLANNSQQEILSAKRTAQVHLIGRKLNLKEGKGNATVIMPEVLEDSNKYEYKLKQFCRERGMIAPSYSVSVREAGNQSKYYDCKLSVGDGFNISTYSAETHNEIAARELASKKAYNKLSMNDNLSSTLYDTEFVIRLKETCSEKNLPEPIFKTMECHPKNQPKYFISKVRIGDDILLSSYPVEAVDELSARDLAAKKAYDYLSLRNKSPAPISKGDKSILVQIFDMLKSKEYGVWCNKLQNLYWETYNEELPENWFELVQKSSKFEITNIEKVGYIIRSKNCSEGIEDFSETPELASLKVPESNHWEVYITNVVSSAEVWCRLIGKEYSEIYDAMMTKLELHPPTKKVESPIVGEVYLVNLEESWNRVRVIEIFQDKNEVSVFLIDIGVDEVVKNSQLFYLQKSFFSVPPQAILLSLNELDCLAECEELQFALFHSLLGNTFIAEIVAILDEGGNVSSVNLWDTSTEEDINVNLKLLDDVIKSIKSPTLPTIGIVKEMFVSCVDDDGYVYLQASKQNATFVEWIIATKMKNSGSLISVHNKKVDSKKLYVTRSNKTGLFYRAKVIKTLDSNIVLVKFIDYGYEQQAAIDDLLDLEQTSVDLATIPSQVVRAKFSSSKALSNKTLAKIRDDVLNQNVLVKVTQAPLGSPPMVELFKRSQIDGTLSSINNKILKDQEVQMTDAPSRKKSYVVGLENTLTRNLPMPNIPPVGSYFNVFVTLAAHPGLFNVQPLATQNELMELMFRLQEKCEQFFSKPLSPNEFKIGELYAVKHSDNFWYRAYAQAFTGSASFIVCLCDFGDFVEASPDKLMPLSGEFKTFPYQAIRAYLAGIEPVNKDWPALDCVQFRELVVEKQFVSQIIEINRDVKNPNYISLGLLLVDTSTSEDLYIHKLLVDKNMAVLKSLCTMVLNQSTVTSSQFNS